MKQLLNQLALAGVAAASITTAAFAAYPEKPITLVIPLGAGGSHDLNARVITSIVSAYLNQAMIVRLSPGESGRKGTKEVAEAEPDGYTLLFSQNYIDMLQQHVLDVPYNPVSDFVPVARINYAPITVVVRHDSPYQSFEDLLNAAEAAPGEITVSHSGAWGASFVPAAQIMKATGTTLALESYQGGGPAMDALRSGEVDFTLAFPAGIEELVFSGELRVLATAGSSRVFEDVPTFAELGLGEDIGFMHRIVLAPAETPDDVLETLEAAFEAMVDDPTYVRMMGQLGENTEFIDSDNYQIMRMAQNDAYKDLVANIRE